MSGPRPYKPKTSRRGRGMNRNMTLNNTQRPYQSVHPSWLYTHTAFTIVSRRRLNPRRKYSDKPCPRFSTTGKCRTQCSVTAHMNAYHTCLCRVCRNMQSRPYMLLSTRLRQGRHLLALSPRQMSEYSRNMSTFARPDPRTHAALRALRQQRPLQPPELSLPTCPRRPARGDLPRLCCARLLRKGTRLRQAAHPRVPRLRREGQLHDARLQAPACHPRQPQPEGSRPATLFLIVLGSRPRERIISWNGFFSWV